MCAYVKILIIQWLEWGHRFHLHNEFSHSFYSILLKISCFVLSSLEEDNCESTLEMSSHF